MDKKKCFIKTRDEETRDALIKAGFQEINSGTPGVYMFVNDAKLVFSDGLKFSYTNKLNL